jgi:hypothetical protein
MISDKLSGKTPRQDQVPALWRERSHDAEIYKKLTLPYKLAYLSCKGFELDSR